VADRWALAALLLVAPLLAGAACAPAPATPPVSEPAPAPGAPPGHDPGSDHDRAPALPAPVGLPADPGEAGARAFVDELMAARVRGDQLRARDFLSPTALEQYERGAGGLVLTGPEGAPFSGWELLGLNAADANSYEVTVLVRADPDFEETFFIGPGPDASGTQRPWIVRGATRS
jgi:hypothetical protein